MVLNHGHHGVLHVLLILSQLGGHFLCGANFVKIFKHNTSRDGYLVKLLGKSLDDHVAICDFLAVELNEGQHSLLGAVLALVVHILKIRALERITHCHHSLSGLMRNLTRKFVQVCCDP